jgi:hypothetical protein
MEINIDRLHDVILEIRNEKQCGKTVAMIVTSLGYADFEVPNIWIYCGTKANAYIVKQKFIEILISTDFTWEIKEKMKILVEKTTYHFVEKENHFEDEEKYCFFDNYYTEFCNINK